LNQENLQKKATLDHLLLRAFAIYAYEQLRFLLCLLFLAPVLLAQVLVQAQARAQV
jgi:hypothetical protein